MVVRNKYKYIFGPVNSRRLGISLGVDLVPFKTCPLNCVYCECGNTTDLTSKIDEYVPTDEVLQEIDDYLSGKPKLDIITFSGSGEPTLHKNIGRIIDHIKNHFSGYKIAVLTNGIMLSRNSVRRAISKADLVIPSLDAVSIEVFNRIARPVPGITPEKLIDGLADFRQVFSGEMILEIFIVPGINDTPAELKKIRNAFDRIKPDRIQINSLDRPGAEDWVSPVGKDTLSRIEKIFAPFRVEMIGSPGNYKFIDKHGDGIMRKIISTLERRPSTIEDLYRSFGIREEEIAEIIEMMLKKGIISKEKLPRGEFYKVVKETVKS